VSARTVLAIARREFAGAFASPVAWAWLTVFLALTNWFFFRAFFPRGLASLRDFFGLAPWTLLFLVPALTMRLFAEERKLGTLEVLLTWPVREHEAVLGKYLGSLGVLAVSLLATAPLPLAVFALGSPDPGPVAAGYLGLLLLGGCYLAIGLFASALTENQIVAYLLAAAMTFALFAAGEAFVLVAAPPPLVPLLAALGLGAHFTSIGRGVIDTRDVVYFASVIFLFLYLAVRRLEGRRW
jgi:ABC-2 type transport system permease protein